MSLCDEGCEYKSINLDDMTSTCDCKFNDISNNNAIKDNELMNEAFGEIFDIINSSNILVFKCIKYIFKHFSRSIGAWISLTLIISHLSMTAIYFLFQSIKVKKYMFTLTKSYISYISNNNRKKSPNPPKRSVRNKSQNDKYSYIQINSETNLKKKNNQKKPIINSKFNNDDFTIPFKGNIKLKITNNDKSVKTEKIGTDENLNNKVKQSDLNMEEYDDKFFEEYMSTSPDDMEFDDAVAKDKRTYCEHMVENLIEDQIILSTFIAKDKLKPRSIKIVIFILNVILYFVVNGLFFSEEVISELYNVDKEKENFFSFIPRSIERLLYTTLVSIIIGIITNFFFVNENKIKGIFKREKNDVPSLKRNMSKFMKDLKKRYIIFIIIVTIILIISFLYLLCFNYVYPYSQIEWIKSSIAIMIIMQILSFLKCILETSLRYLSYKCKSEKLYKISMFLD